jgi:signal transduction histidine kinase
VTSRALWPVALVAAGAAAAAGVGAVYGWSHVTATALFFGAFGSTVIAGSWLLARGRVRLGSLSRQFVAGVGGVFGLAMIGVGVVALLMFVDTRDAFILGALLAFAACVTMYSGWLLGRGVKRDIDAVGERLAAIGRGERDFEPLRTGGRDEIAALAAATDTMTERLADGERRRDAAEEARRDLVSAISHDLRTPLTSLELLAQAIDDGVIESGWLRAIPVHVRSMSALVDDLFELTRIEAGEIQWSMERVRVDELVREAVDAMRADAAAKGVDVHTSVPSALAPASANPEKLQRVLFNLIQNAIRHTPTDGSVTVTAESNGTALQVEVADTGDGIPADDRERVFEPFFRSRGQDGRSTDERGLGLSICRAIVEVHGGSIWVAEAAHGTSVRFTVPRAG